LRLRENAGGGKKQQRHECLIPALTKAHRYNRSN
jgi:hypothetical protein